MPSKSNVRERFSSSFFSTRSPIAVISLNVAVQPTQSDGSNDFVHELASPAVNLTLVDLGPFPTGAFVVLAHCSPEPQYLRSETLRFACEIVEATPQGVNCLFCDTDSRYLILGVIS